MFVKQPLAFPGSAISLVPFAAGSVVSPGDELTLLPGLNSHKVEGIFGEVME